MKSNLTIGSYVSNFAVFWANKPYYISQQNIHINVKCKKIIAAKHGQMLRTLVVTDRSKPFDMIRNSLSDDMAVSWLPPEVSCPFKLTAHASIFARFVKLGYIFIFCRAHTWVWLQKKIFCVYFIMDAIFSWVE